VLNVCLILALALTVAPLQHSYAANITVDANSDVLDAAVNCAAVTVASLPGLDGVISLREAICAANNSASADTIDFNIPGVGVHTVDLLSALPILADNLTTIDGYSQPGAAPADEGTPATILIAIDGTGILNNGLNVTSSGNVIQGLAIYGFAVSEIYVANFAGRVANDNVIAGNYLGADSSGALCPGADDKGLNGVFVGAGAQNNVIGGDSPAERTMISCNGWEGVGIHGSGTTGNVVSGNYIGVDPLGTTSRANTLDGVRIYGGAQNNTVGGDTPGERNVISGNARDGVRIVGAGSTGNLVMGNYIGLEPDGASARSNDHYGVYLGGGAQNNTIGRDRTAEEGNVISGNLMGVVISDTATMSNTVSGNYIGTDSSGAADVGNTADGVGVLGGAQTNLIGGDSVGERNVISGNLEDGVHIEGLQTTDNVVSGNYIGTDVTGASALPNDSDGVEISSAPDNLIGGDTPGERNVISGNGEGGVYISSPDATGNVVSGNYIGVDATGAAALPNIDDGVTIWDAADNVIGGDTPGERNVISGNGYDGILLRDQASGNVVSGNYIGVDATGAAALPNFDDGVHILSGLDNLVGGNIPGERNIISGNGDDGVTFSSDATNTVVSGNYIGLAADGTTRLPNTFDGVEIGDQAYSNTIGGDTSGERNIISGNGGNGVSVEGHDNVISGNYIGTDAPGTAARGNMLDGVYLTRDADSNLIGGDAPGARNLISGNESGGIDLNGADNNTLAGNYIGVNAGGTDVLANDGFGASMGNGAEGNTIGGDTAAEGNIISGNSRAGMYVAGVTTFGNVISNNYIGTDASGTADLGNDDDGIELDFGTHDNVIGPGNVLAHNGYCGVFVDDDTTIGNTITQNRIFSNSVLGICLTEGAHGGIAAPEIADTEFAAGDVTVAGSACSGCTVEVFGNSTDDGEGEFYVGSATTDGSGAFSLVLTALPYLYLTATATDVTNGTSEFSRVFTSTVATVYLPLVLR
jgi:parallel beta-helix repeat protein